MHNDSRLLSLNKRKPVWREIEIGETEKDYKMRIGAPCLWSNYYSYGNKSWEKKNDPKLSSSLFAVLFSFFFSIIFLVQKFSAIRND